MKAVAVLLNALRKDGIILDYAVFEAMAQMRYTEAVATLDADILVAVPDEARIDILAPIYRHCHSRGHHAEGEAIRIGNWPVQFVPAFDIVTRDAIAHAEVANLDGEPLRVVSASYLAVIALGVGRAKDFARICALIESNATTPDDLARLAATYNFTEPWTRFRRRFLDG